MRIGRLASPEGALAPTMVRCPPGKRLCRILFDPSRDFGSAILPTRHGVSRAIGEKRSFDQASASRSVGMTTMIGAGSWSM